mmetsp:Transcript_17682/g.38631  ORF Transcript_17682/g.38631 Transcript_17682/m.38631 type:complete len:221 (-) Transcript_17682:91-753(-)
MKYFIACSLPLVLALLQEKVCRVASFQSSNYHRNPTSILPSTFTLSRDIIGDKSVSFHMVEKGKGDDGSGDFWEQQRDLMKELSDVNEKSLKEENKNNFDKIQKALVTETVFFSALLFSLLWLACDNPYVPLSFVFGSLFGIAYTYGLGKFVSTVGGTIDDANAVEGAGVGQARFAFLIMLFIFLGKLRPYGLMEIPSIMGFFTYQLASLSQGLKEEKIV